MAALPDKIGKYKIISEIARGGMGAVYTAEHPTLDRTVIIKKLTLRGNASVRERFRREASIMMDFRNEYIVDVYDHFREGPAYYIVQEFVDGMSLSDLLRRERYLPERIALLIFRDCCRALKYAHDRGVIHRDIKPANILLSRRGDVKLVDFGIAHVEDDDETVLTREGTMLGTPSYMAPEQFQDTRGVDKRADIYSLGVMLYELLTGKRPFPGSINPDTLNAIQHGRYRRARKLNPAITKFTASLVGKAMSAKRSRRYQDLGVVIAKLDRRLGSRAVAEQRPFIASYLAGTWSPPSRSRKIGRALAIAGAIFLVLAAGGVYYGIRVGVVTELMHPDEYGSLEVTVRVARGETSAQEMYLSGELFRDNGTDIPRVEGVRFGFHLDSVQTTSETDVFVSRMQYLPAGQYRLKLMTPGRLVWSGFYLHSRAHELASADPRASKSLVVSIGPQESLPLTVTFRITSAADGQPIAGGTEISLYSDGTWLPVTDTLLASLRSGTTYQFRFVHPGYYTAEYALLVSSSESRLAIDASLVPLPATVELSANAVNVRVLIDGSQTYRQWGRTPHPEQTPRIGQKPVAISLAPGAYVLGVQSGSLHAERKVNLSPLDRLALRIVFDRKTGTVGFEQSGG
ncbi:MAG TPA: protein kinase [Spirochaetia bacterium]|nr:protein kinase [Spirochaetia bacterium]